MYVQALASEHNKPFVTVHHLEAHCLIARLAGDVITAIPELPSSASLPVIDPTTATATEFSPKVEYPFLGLLVSGGHTSLLVCRGLGDYSVIGATLDDSLGGSINK